MKKVLLLSLIAVTILLTQTDARASKAFIYFVQGLKLAGELSEVSNALENLPQNIQKDSSLSGLKLVKQFTNITFSNTETGETMKIRGDQARILIDPSLSYSKIIAVYNEVFNQFISTPERFFKHLGNEFIGISGLNNTPVMKLYYDDMWHLIPIGAFAQFRNPKADPKEIVKLLDMMMPEEQQVTLAENNKDIIVEGIPVFDLAFCDKSGVWELDPKPSMAALMVPGLTAEQYWEAYKIGFAELLKQLIPLSIYRDKSVYWSDGYISTPIYELKKGSSDAIFEWEVSIHPDFSIFTNTFTLVQQNDFDQIIATLKASKNQSDFLNLFLGDAYLKKGDIEHAVKIAEKLTRKYPDSILAKELQIAVSLESGNTKAALENALGVIGKHEHDKKNSLAHFYANAACALLKQNNRTKARVYYQEAIAIDSSLSDIKKLEKEIGRIPPTHRALMLELEKIM